MNETINLLCTESMRVTDSNIKHFLIFTVDHYTFLLVKSTHNNHIQPEIGLVLQNQTYQCTFSRHVSLNYAAMLSNLLKIVAKDHKNHIQDEWLMLYDILSFPIQKYQNYAINTSLYAVNPVKTPSHVVSTPSTPSTSSTPSKSSTPSYVVNTPSYGSTVAILSSPSKVTLKYVSNAFKKSGKIFYFLNEDKYPNQSSQFQPILSVDLNILYGILLKVNNINICLPFMCVLSERMHELKIQRNLHNILERTCYLYYHTSYCTGVLISPNTIITTKHLLPKSDQTLMTKVYLRIFPFQKIQVGHVSKIASQHVDFIQITINSSSFSIPSDEQKHQVHQSGQQKHQVKKINKQPISSQTLYSYPKLLASQQNKEKSLQQNKRTQCKKIFLGCQMMALGFGKYSFQNDVFQEYEVVLPTISCGHISKLINFNSKLIYIKTDAGLYNGFSGCGIWSKQQAALMGMAVFILKNKSNLSSYHRHNFSYSQQFLTEILKQPENTAIQPFIQEFKMFDQIHTRKQIFILPKL